MRPTESQHLPLATYSLAADVDPARQLERHPSGMIPLGWAADARCPPPLALPPPPAAGQQAQPEWLGAEGGRRELRSAGGVGVGGGRSAPAAPRPVSGPASLPWPGGGASGGGSPITPLAQPQARQAGVMAHGTPAFGRPASSEGGHGAAAYGGGAVEYAAGDDAEPRPRPSPWGLRPYGSPAVSGAAGDTAAPPSPAELDAERWGTYPRGGSAQQQHIQPPGVHQGQQQLWGAAEDECEDGTRADGVRLGSPVRVERAAAGVGAQQAAALGLKVDAAAAASTTSLPALLGGPYSSSPRHMVHGVSSPFAASPGRPRDALRDSLDTGRRAVSAAAAAIASAEAAVMRGTAGGAGGSRGGVRDGVGTGPAAATDDPLRLSLQQSAHAVGGLAAALNAASTALQAPDAGGSIGAGPARSPLRGEAPGGHHRVVVLPPHDAWADPQGGAAPNSAGGAPSPAPSPWPEGSPHHWLPQVQQQQAAAAGGAMGPLAGVQPPASVVAVASWLAPPQDVSARELRDEVVRLRAEVGSV